MKYDEPPILGRLIRRYKRFLADVELEDGSVVTAHCPNTGSLLGCKEEGSQVWLRDSKDEKRKLRLTWQAIRVGRTWVSVDTNLPNRAVSEALEARRIPSLTEFDTLRREVKYGQNSRIDVLLESEGGPRTYIEVKSTTLREGTAGLFPDAVTARGKKHLEELMDVVRAGDRAVQFFLVCRSDVKVFRPADTIDPVYCSTLREAAETGVEVLAHRAKVRARSFDVGEAIDVDLSQPALS